MGLDELRTFVAIARLGGFSRAAESLHRSQPAISRRIEQLEQDLGAPLFERVRGGAILTDAGAALLPHAEAVLAAAKDGLDAVAAVAGGVAGRVSLALVGTLANTRLTEVLSAFRASHPGVRLDLQTAASLDVGALVLRGEATLGLRYQVDTSPGLVSHVVTQEALRVVGRRGHPLADGRAHPPKDLAGERWVAFPTRGAREPFVQVLARRLASAGLDEPEVIPIDSLTAQKRLVEAGFGLALLAESGVEEELRTGVLAVIDAPDLAAKIPVSVVHRKGGYLSPAAKALLALIERSLADSAQLL